MRAHPFRLLVLLLITLTMPPLAAAQETTGTITGTVTDATGAVMPGVTVSVKHLETGDIRTFVTNDAGRYRAALLPVGSYEVVFELTGFQPVTVRGIALHVNDRLEIDGRLAVGGVNEVIEVTAASTFVQTTPAVQGLIGETQVLELPLNNRNFAQLATLVPGVSSDLEDEVGVGLTSRVNISVNGARRNAVNWLVDGVSNVDVGSNITLLSTPTLDSIEEFKIITSSYQAEWPRSGGGIVNVVTKSGSSRYAGSLYEFLRHDGLNANSFFRKQSTNSDIRDNPPRLRYNNFGYTVGGPVLPLPNRLFFFFSEEWRRIKRAPASLTADVPDPAWLTDPANANYVAPELRDPNAVRLLAAWPAPNVPGRNQFINTVPNVNNTRQEVIRVDYDLGANWRLTGRFTHDLSETEEIGGLFFGIRVPGLATTATDVPGVVGALQLKTVLGANRLNELSYQRSGNVISTTNPEGTRGTRDAFGLTIGELFAENNANRIPTIAITGLALGTIGSAQLYHIEYVNHTFTDNFTWVRGDHSYKMGALVTFESKNENAANTTQGSFSFVNTAGGPTAFQSFLTGNRDGRCPNCSYSEAEIDITNNLRFQRYEFYVQDTWKVGRNLTVDYGIRYSLYPPVKDENDILTNFDPALYDPAQAPTFANPQGSLVLLNTGNRLNGIVVAGANSPHGRGIYRFDKNNVQPRLGLTWDLFDDNRTILRAGYGMYFDQPLVGIFEQNAFVNPPFNNTAVVLNPALSNPGAGVAAGTAAVRSLQATSDPFHTPRTQQWNVGMQYQLYGKGMIDVGYVGARGDNLIRPVDINQPHPRPWLRCRRDSTRTSSAPSEDTDRSRCAKRPRAADTTAC